MDTATRQVEGNGTTQTTIKVSETFSRFPAGRYASDGSNSGERFRDDFLAPALVHYDEVIVEMDGPLGYGSSFLEEAFGGLIRVHGYNVTSLKRKLRLITEDTQMQHDINQYLLDADNIAVRQ